MSPFSITQSTMSATDDKASDKVADAAAPREASILKYEGSPDSLAQGEAQPGDWDSVELQRIDTYRLQRQQTVGSCQDPPPKEQWLPLGAGKPYPASPLDPENYVVEFEGADDPIHPQNWATRKKYVVRCVIVYRG